MLVKDMTKRSIVIPHDKEVSVGIILTSLKIAGISRKDFIAAMGKSKKEKPY